MSTLVGLDTPALVLERSIVERNTRVMRERMNALGVNLRPHLKTAKSARVAELAVEPGRRAITVSTLREAAYFLDKGFQDLLYAVGITPQKLPQVQALRRRGAELKIVTDSSSVARELANAAAGGAGFDVLIEVDTGGARAGLRPDGAELLALAAELDGAAGVNLVGVMTHAGHSYHCRSLEEVCRVGREERDGVVLAASRLREAGFACPVVSAGSTPTAVHADDLTGVTEMRPGVYVFYDLDQLALGSCARGDIALSVLASVIGHNRNEGHLLIDAGALALSKDLSATEFWPQVCYGEVCEANTLAPLEGLFVQRVHQEHGIIPVADEGWFDRLTVGAKVRVLPNHACMTAAAYPAYQVVEGTTVVEVWDRTNGW